MLVLGGDRERELAAARLLAGQPQALQAHASSCDENRRRLLCEGTVYVSSGHQDVERVMLCEGVAQRRLHVDFQAVDTVCGASLVTIGTEHI